MFRYPIVVFCLILPSLLCKSSLFVSAKLNSKKGGSGEVLYVWTGSGVQQADYLAVVDFDQNSKTYGKILRKVELDSTSTRAAIGNEPHHCKIKKTSNGKNVLVTGGLLSFLQGKDDVFVWNLDDPKNPKLSASYNLPGGCADEINSFKHGNLDGVLVTMMCSDAAGSPGYLAFLDPLTGNLSDWANSTDLVDFNPHGFDINKNDKYIVATDFILPGSLVSGPPVFRNTLRRFDLDRANPVLDHIYPVGTGVEGFMDFHFKPGTTEGYTSGTVSNLLYFVDTSTEDQPVAVLDLAETVNGGQKTLSVPMFRFMKSGNILFQSFGRRYLVGTDVTDRLAPKVFFQYDFCTQPVTGNQGFDCSVNFPGTHYVFLTPNEDRLVVVNYFLKFGIMQNVDASTVAVFDIIQRKNKQPVVKYNPRFSLNMFPDRPHGVEYFGHPVEPRI